MILLIVGSKDPKNRALVSKYHEDYSIWALRFPEPLGLEAPQIRPVLRGAAEAKVPCRVLGLLKDSM